MEPAELAASMARIATELQREAGEELTARSVVHRALDIVPGATWASLTIRRRRGELESLGSTHEVAQRADDLQYSLHEGPCVDSVEERDWFVSEDVSQDERWPRWGPKAADLGVGSLLALLVHSGSEPVCALNLYSERTHAFDDGDEVDLAMLYARHAANALTSAHEVAGLQVAVESRHLIGMAQGVAMARYGLTVDQSFDLLRRLSSTTNTKLRELAQVIVDTREVPASDAGDLTHSGE